MSQIPRVLELLQQFRSDTDVRAGLAAMPPAAGAEDVKTAVLSDLDRYLATHDPTDSKAFQEWVRVTESSLRAWHERLARLPYVMP